jgi:hypothetical protein
MPLTVTSSVLIACEGLSDATFLKRLAHYHNLQGIEIHYPKQDTVGAAGKSGFERLFRAFRISIGSQSVPIKKLLVFTDADDNPDKAFNEIKKSLQRAGFPIPTSPFELLAGDVLVAVFLVPGTGKNGTLEHLLLSAALDARPEVRECIEKFSQCLPYVSQWKENKRTKMWLQVFTAACYEDDPCIALSWLLGKPDCPIPINSNHFAEIVSFLWQFPTV